MTRRYDCIIVGGGVIGLAIAWRTSQLGLSTLVCEAGRGPRGASWAAAGMLAPVTEAAYGENNLLKLNLKSAELYEGFLEDLSEAAGIGVAAETAGTLFAALDRDQAEALARLFDFQKSLGLEAEWLDGAQSRELEPGMHPRTRAAIFAPRDRAVDPRSLLSALKEALFRAGGRIELDSPVRAIHGAPHAGITLERGQRVSGGRVVLSAGCWCGEIEGCPPEVADALRPVKGQILRLSSRPPDLPFVNHIIRTEEVYMVPRKSGEVAVGASVEEKGYDASVTAGAVLDLLRAADEAVPGIRELELTEASAGLRPGTPDNAPLLGPTSCDGVVAAAGHFRNGILLAPITAYAIASFLDKGTMPEEAAGFDCGRFLSRST